MLQLEFLSPSTDITCEPIKDDSLVKLRTRNSEDLSWHTLAANTFLSIYDVLSLAEWKRLTLGVHGIYQI
jgi:hypothetical protein